MPFPEDLDEFFRYGSSMSHTSDNQVVPDSSMTLKNPKVTYSRAEDQAQIKKENTIDTNIPVCSLKTLRRTTFLKSPQAKQYKIDKDRQIDTKTQTTSPITELSMYPETPLRKFSRLHDSGPEFQVVRPQIVPETPRQIVLNGGHDSNVYCVPETPLIDVFKTPWPVEY